MTGYSAHSPKPDKGIPLQEYAEHINEVRRRANKAAADVCRYAVKDGTLFRQVVENAAVFHDLGKLDESNQQILLGKKKARSLPVNHTDAGAAYFLDDEHCSPFAAAAIQAHHIGYPDFITQQNTESPFRDLAIKKQVDKALPEWLKIHQSLVNDGCNHNTEENVNGDMAVFLRLVLSCLADADHTDTAVHYREYPKEVPVILLRASERLTQLDKYVNGLKNVRSEDERTKQRQKLRQEMYEKCRSAETTENIVSCDSPVGSGKTTAVMAHLLAQAEKRGLRRIFVILPFTNIIKQSVETYRKALVLPGENPEEVIAELHHRADFQSYETRQWTALWNAPIIVTTAVAFFETLASNTPATLRRLHQLPGSAVFVDESHAALPAELLPLAWQWLNIFANEWSCYWVLASGSLCRFWNIDEIAKQKISVPEIVDDALRNNLLTYENNRIIYRNDLQPRNTKELAEWITGFSGPRLVIMNTVQSAAVLADYFAKNFGLDKVEHLSTALTPIDREKTLHQVKRRLDNAANDSHQYKVDNDWTLIATSCVEAGMDFSFRTGFRELGSLVSLLQAAGRINRKGEYAGAEIWTFRIAENDEMLKRNRQLDNAAAVLQSYFEGKKSITPELSTQSIQDEIRRRGQTHIFEKLVNDEDCRCFPEVEKKFKVIDSDTRITLINRELIEHIKKHEKVSWQDIQKHSVQVAKYKLTELKIPELLDGIYGWTLTYNDFLGYMAGIIDVKSFSGNGQII